MTFASVFYVDKEKVQQKKITLRMMGTSQSQATQQSASEFKNEAIVLGESKLDISKFMDRTHVPTTLNFGDNFTLTLTTSVINISQGSQFGLDMDKIIQQESDLDRQKKLKTAAEARGSLQHAQQIKLITNMT